MYIGMFAICNHCVCLFFFSVGLLSWVDARKLTC